MEKSETISQRLESANRRSVLLIATSGYVVLTVMTFVALVIFLNIYLGGLAKSQSYSIAVQEWRGVINGISSGWRFFPPLDGLCVVFQKTPAAVAHDCPASVIPWTQLGGRIAAISTEGIEVRVILKYTLWLWAFFLPFLVLLPILLLYGALKGRLTRRIYLDIINQLRNPVPEASLSEFQQKINMQMEEIVALKREASVAQLAAQVAHDIRSPLGALRVASRQFKDLPEDLALLLNTATNRIAEITENLLSTYRSQQNREASQELTSQVNVLELIAPILQEKRAQLDPKSAIRIDVENPRSEKAPLVTARAADLKRVVSNLIQNAFEAVDPTSGVIRVGAFARDEKCFLIIIDNGKGISANILPKLWKKGASFGKTGGTGLGLFHAKCVIEAMGGTIRIDSQESVGTTVTIEVPLAIQSNKTQ